MILLRSWWWRVWAVLACAAAAAAATMTDTQQASSETTSPLVQQLENSLLASFGLKRRPQTKLDVMVPPYMLEMFRKQQAALSKASTATTEEVKDTTSTTTTSTITTSSSFNTVRSFTHQESQADARYPTHKMRLRFNLASIPNGEALNSAELRLTHRKHPATPDPLEEKKNASSKAAGRIQRRWTSEAAPYLKRVMVYDVLRRATRSSEPALRLLDSKLIDSRQMGVESIDVTDAVQRWMLKPKSNNGLLVEIVPFTKTSTVDSSHVRLKRSAEELDVVWSQQEPLLIVYTDDAKSGSRTKRSVVNKHKKTRESCRRHRLHVDFRQVGWDDWIVAPSGYDAYFCKGECNFPLQDSLNTTNHAVVQTLVNSRYPDRVPKACCVPTELSPVSLLYMDDDKNFVLKNHQDMVVEGCGCR